MIAKGLLWTVVYTKAIVDMIVRKCYRATVPYTTALYTEMIIDIAGQKTISASGLQQYLGQRNARRYSILVHLRDGYILILFNIAQSGCCCGSATLRCGIGTIVLRSRAMGRGLNDCSPRGTGAKPQRYSNK